jgi:predicted phage baseplate assembly protein
VAAEEHLEFDFLPKLPKNNLDDRTFEDLVAECILRIPRYCPEWTDYNPSDPGITLIELFAWLTDQMLLRFNQVPRRNYITFLELLGIRLQPPTPARTELTFYVTQPDVFPYRIPAGTEVGTEKLIATEEAIVFSTDRDLLIGQPSLRYFLTAEVTEEAPRLLRDGVTNQWTRQPDGEWGGSGQSLFDEQPQPGNCFYLVFASEQPIEGNVIAIAFRGLGATPTGIDPDHPPRSWEAWNGEEWRSVLAREADDYTRGFSFNQPFQEEGSGVQTADVILHLPPKWPVTTFTGYEGRWVRCAYTSVAGTQPGYSNSPQIVGLNVRSIGGIVSASHSTLIRDELLGVSNGTPGQTFRLQGGPALARREDEHILVVPSGAPPQIWKEVRDFADSQPEDRHYTIDSLTGTVQFGPLIQEPSRHVQQTEIRASLSPLPALGDYPGRRVTTAEGHLERQYGSIPPRGAEIRMRAYRTGGGRQGNVERETLKILKSAVPYIVEAINRQPASGGADAESLQQAVLRAPKMLRTRDRAVTGEDFETLTLEAGKGAIAKALCLSATTTQEAGTVSILVVPRADIEAIERGDGLPPDAFQLPASLEEQILAYLNQRKLLGVQVRLNEPNYVGVAVETQIGLEPAYQNSQAQAIMRSQLEVALYRFLNPITGGVEGIGWSFGRPVYVSDIVALFQQIPGVRYIGPVLLYEIRQRRESWVRHPEPVQLVDPGARGLICSWKNRQLGSAHLINFLES